MRLNVPLAFLNDLRLKLRLAIPRNTQAYFAEFGFDSLGSVAISRVVNGLGFLVVLFESQMVSQLLLKKRSHNSVFPLLSIFS